MTASTVYETEISVSEMCSLVSADLWEKENTCVFYRFIEIRVEVLEKGNAVKRVLQENVSKALSSSPKFSRFTFKT